MSNLIKYFVIFVVGIFILGILFFVSNNFSLSVSEVKLITPLAAATSLPQSASEAVQGAQSNENLKNIVETGINDDEKDYGVFIKNLSSGEEYFYNEHAKFEAASLYKLWVMATVFEEIKKGTIAEEVVLSANLKDLYEKFDVATESADFKDEEISLPVSEALRRMITISDNNAALLLSGKLGLSKVRSFLSRYEFADSSMKEVPITSAYDIGIFFEKLEKGEIIDQDYSHQMIEILKNQAIKRKIPKYLPDDIEIAHKTGELYPYTHDGGIVYSPKNSFIIIIMSKDPKYKEAEEKIAKLSESVFNYFEK
ncbi:hypothetical protein A2773_04025 [Candidatus Gottesmanbacteria bacterium RIFCSPHIGHO2_01_FULL_39_10]|uniref:Beta-lactamase class A catalytic domain-containing protein n=1 Tax=Candidatus Gottesmanbacteria bacterium RIFCSPHIGHO2_01_FULL_39_10 TaxID=1798375 RepID=A0A1F5ZQZ5_9BACT|nr:MAG: hypothetical protein A2773_04025 [Candidatus Gottesmanbacteria bacterium RIFCSPHIGHO2_01_FULL_39_10]